MTEKELITLTQTLVPIVREYVAKSIGELLPRLAVAESRLELLGDVRDRVVAVETKAVMPMVVAPSVDLTPLQARLTDLEARIALLAGETALTLTKELGAVRERLAVVETRAPVAGPPGKDGADGLGVDDLAIVQQDDRSFTIKAVRGDRVKEIGTAKFPGIPVQRGVFVEGKSYETGDVVTSAGSQWACNESTTTKPIDGSKVWTLIVKRGRDGKDGAPGADGKPGRDLTQKEGAWRS